MNLLDENFPDDQFLLLKRWGIAVRKFGRELGHEGVGDTEIITMLHHCGRPTFFTLDRGFYRRALCHHGYCIVWLDVRTDDAAFYVRRFLRHPQFRRRVMRMGVVARINPSGIRFWQPGNAASGYVAWPD